MLGRDLLDFLPEHRDQKLCQAGQRAVVELGSTSLEIVDEQLPHPTAPDGITVHQLGHGLLAGDQHSTEVLGRPRREDAHAVQCFPGRVAGETAASRGRAPGQPVLMALERIVQ